jgi:hypothetical protein
VPDLTAEVGGKPLFEITLLNHHRLPLAADFKLVGERWTFIVIQDSVSLLRPFFELYLPKYRGPS